MSTLDVAQDIALIGMAIRFPGANDVEAFWRNLRDGIESITFFDDSDLLESGVDQALLNDQKYVKAKPILDDIERFDAAFFGFLPREAAVMAPQYRCFMECAWEALEHAGHGPGTYAGSIGVYAGSSLNSYFVNHLVLNHSLPKGLEGLQFLPGIDNDYLATGISYKLDLKGPSVSVQTFCSTSLVAVHMACQSLLNYECDMALAGGSSVKVPQKAGYYYQQGGLYSPDGHCRAFDAAARGTVFGNGVGVVVLKRLEDALADGDFIHALIKGSAINNDGMLKVSFTAPSVEGQARVIAEALAAAAVEAETLSYVETHGTGTALGDPIEIEALKKAFGETQRRGFCAIGSVKTNIGHLESAAGVASLIKTVLALQHQQIPPSLHFQRPNAQIDFANSPFYVNATLSDWPKAELPRRASVSSFGIGGTNAHVIVEEAPAPSPGSASRPWQLLLLSAKTLPALEAATRNLATHLRQHPALPLPEVAYTLQVGRTKFNHRRMVLCQNISDALEALDTCHPNRMVSADQQLDDRPVAFMLPGQGSQFVHMGREIYQSEPRFRQHFDLCAEQLAPNLSFDLRTVVYPQAEPSEQAAQRLHQTAVTQPALFAFEYALAQLWQAWGIQPQALLGHGIGEYVAACLSGTFSLPDALALVCARGRLMQALPGGAMLAVPYSESEIEPYLGPELALAAVNGPSACVVSGASDVVAALQERLRTTGVESHMLRTSHAFHSHAMGPILDAFRKQVEQIELHAPSIPYLSNVTGGWIDADQATDPDYWVTHLRQTVRFSQNLEALWARPEMVLLEVGPGQALSALAARQPGRPAEQLVLSSLAAPQNRQSDIASLLTALGQLWLAGATVDWPAFYANEQRRRLPLPTYPFQRQRCWIDTTLSERDAEPTPVPSTAPVSPAYREDRADWFYAPTWRCTPSPQRVAAETDAHWLVFASPDDLGQELAEQLRQTGVSVVVVHPGAGFKRQCEDVYVICPDHAEDYQVLFAELNAMGSLPNHLVHMWHLTPAGPHDAPLQRLEDAFKIGYCSLLLLIQTLGQQAVTDYFRIAVISNRLYSLAGEQTLCPEKALLLGPATSVAKEYSNIGLRYVDIISPPAEDRPGRQLLPQLLRELHADTAEPVVVYRGHNRWVQAYESTPLKPIEPMPSRLRNQGVYFITGGLEGIGLQLARYLAESLQAKLVLVGSASQPEDESRTLQALEALGAEVIAVSADVSDLEQMQSVVSTAQARFGPIHGVIHADGAGIGRLIQFKTRELIDSMLLPRVKSVLVLDDVFRDAELDFFALCSSLSSVLGKFALVDNSALNALLQTYAHYRAASDGTYSVCINWDGWWQESATDGSAPRLEFQQWWEEEQAVTGIPVTAAGDLLSRVLESSLPQAVVSPTDFLKRWREDRVLRSQQWQGAQGTAETVQPKPPHTSRPDIGSDYVAPRDALEQQLVEIWQEFLGMEPVGIDDPFFALGGDSLLAVSLVTQVQQQIGMKVSLATLYHGPTIAQFAKLLKYEGTD